MKENWYILRTNSNAEFKAAERLKAMGAYIFFPTYLEDHKWSDRIKTVEIPYYRSYIFVRCNMFMLRKYILTKGIVDAVKYNDEIAVMHRRDIDEIKRFMEIAEGCRIIPEAEMIRNINGKFDRKYGEVTRVQTKYIYLSFEYAEDLTICANLKEIL